MKKKAKQENQEIDEEFSSEIEPGEEGEVKQEEEYLTPREKIYVWSSVFASFVFFTVLFLPYGLFTKKIINAVAKPIIIDYTELDFNLFGQNIFYDAIIEISGNNIAKADQTGFDISFFTYLRGGINASIQLVNPDLVYSGTSVKARTVNAEIDLDDIKNLKNSNGNLKFISSQMEITNLNIRMIPIPLENITISGMKVTAAVKNGNVQLDGTRIKVDVFDVIASGNIKLNQSMNSSILNLNICINPVPGSDFDNSSLFGMYLAAGGKIESSLCFQVSGSPASPTFAKL